MYFLVNPRSGGSGTKTVIQNLQNYAKREDAGICVTLIDPARLDQHVAEAHAAETVVIGGGDGTISRLIGHFKNHRRIGFLPLGTGNDLARELRLPRLQAFFDPQYCVTYFSKLQPKPFGLGLLESGNNIQSYFLNYSSFGFDGHVVASFSRMREQGFFLKHRGVWSNRVAYGLAAMQHLTYGLPEDSWLTNLETGDRFSLAGKKGIVIANIRSILGLGKSNQIGSAEDNQLEAVPVYSLLDYGKMVLGSRFGSFSPQVIGSSSKWELDTGSSSIFAQVDGEPRSDLTPGRIRFSVTGTVAILGE
jgi:hypothetical protein